MGQLMPSTYEELKEAVTRYFSLSKPERTPSRSDQRGRKEEKRGDPAKWRGERDLHTTKGKVLEVTLMTMTCIINILEPLKMLSIPLSAVGVAREAITRETAG